MRWLILSVLVAVSSAAPAEVDAWGRAITASQDIQGVSPGETLDAASSSRYSKTANPTVVVTRVTWNHPLPQSAATPATRSSPVAPSLDSVANDSWDHLFPEVAIPASSQPNYPAVVATRVAWNYPPAPPQELPDSSAALDASHKAWILGHALPSAYSRAFQPPTVGTAYIVQPVLGDASVNPNEEEVFVTTGDPALDEFLRNKKITVIKHPHKVTHHSSDKKPKGKVDLEHSHHDATGPINTQPDAASAPAVELKSPINVDNSVHHPQMRSLEKPVDNANLSDSSSSSSSLQTASKDTYIEALHTEVLHTVTQVTPNENASPVPNIP